MAFRFFSSAYGKMILFSQAIMTSKVLVDGGCKLGLRVACLVCINYVNFTFNDVSARVAFVLLVVPTRG